MIFCLSYPCFSIATSMLWCKIPSNWFSTLIKLVFNINRQQTILLGCKLWLLVKVVICVFYHFRFLVGLLLCIQSFWVFKRPKLVFYPRHSLTHDNLQTLEKKVCLERQYAKFTTKNDPQRKSAFKFVCYHKLQNVIHNDILVKIGKTVIY